MTILHKKTPDVALHITVLGDVQTTRFGHMAQKLVESAAVLTGDDRRPLVLSDSDIFRECTRHTQKKLGGNVTGGVASRHLARKSSRQSVAQNRRRYAICLRLENMAKYVSQADGGMVELPSPRALASPSA